MKVFIVDMWSLWLRFDCIFRKNSFALLLSPLALINKLIYATKTDAPHAILINNWIDINTCKKMNKLYYLIVFHCVNIILQNIQEQIRPPGANFTNILCAAFLYASFDRSFFVLTF